jgi:hypothetical protein
VVERAQDLGNQGRQVFHSSALGGHHKDRNWRRCEVLLEFDALIRRQKHVEGRAWEGKQLAILDASPSTLWSRADDMGREQIAKVPRDTSSSRMRIWHQGGPSLFEHSDGQLSTRGRKVIEKHVERVTRLQVVEKRLDRHSAQHRCPAAPPTARQTLRNPRR